MDERSGATAQAETKKPISESIVTAGGILSISPRQYRQYADEWKAFTSRASSDGQRKLGQTMAEIWLDAAARFEEGLKAVQSERLKPKGRFPPP